GFRYVTSTDSPTCAYQYGATPRAFMSSPSLKLDPLAETITLSTGASTSGPVEGSDWIVIPNSDPVQYYCANIGTTGQLSTSMRIVMQVPFLEDGPQPTPTATPTPFSTPTPQGTPTPSPIPTLLPPDKDLNCPPQISNEVDRLMRELERIQASIPGAPPLAGGTQEFSVKNALVYNIAQRLFQLNVGLPSAQQATQLAIGAATGAVAVALANKTALINEKAEIDRQFAEAVRNKNQSEKERLRNESNALNRLIQTASDLVRKAEQAKAQLLQTSQKLAELAVDLSGLNSKTDTDCKEPTPSPSPTLVFPPTPSSTPTARPTPPGCFRDCSPDSDFPDSIDVIDKTGNIAISYSNEQCKEFEHSVAGQQNPMRVFQDQGQIGDLDADCERTGTKLPHIRTNLDWMLDGYNPCDNSNTGKLTELHHFEQNPNGPIAEMSKDIHTRVSHPERPSRIDRDTFNDLRKAYWQTRGYQLKYGNDSTICREP
ncbi:MAG: HNH/ENDO VII family nuclease, partial [Candidatus Sericytochromatia bacterium]